MKLRKAAEVDASNMMKIITQAQAYLKKNGVDQWQDGYPNIEVINKDIEDGNAYVLTKEGEIIATAAVCFDGEPTYKAIYEGEWLSNGAYAVVHRIAVSDTYKGLGVASQMFKEIEKLCLDKGIKSIKIDTHEENVVMQKLLEKNGFEYCGIIYLVDGNKRVAFEKMIER